MPLSARNQFPGKVVAIVEDGVMTEVTIETAGGLQLVAAITTASARRLNLAEGSAVSAVVKATEVMVATAD